MGEQTSKHEVRMADRPADQPPADGTNEQALNAAKRFIETESEVLTRIMGVSGITITVGKGWATNLSSGQVTVDPSFFIEQEYNPDWVNYGMMHEIAAHLLLLIKEPRASRDRIDWVGHDGSRHLFMNIMEDIAGNKLIHSLLPRQTEVAAEVYSERLFSETDYRSLPKHIQFMYKMIRQEMIPDSDTLVDAEVDAALTALRESDSGDIIKLSTDRFKSGTVEPLPKDVQTKLWLTHIYPKFEELMEIDEQDPRFSKQKQEGNDDSQAGEQAGSKQDGKANSASGGGDFSPYYDDYEKNRHPDPLGHEEAEKIIEDAIEHETRVKKAEAEDSPTERARERLRAEIGNHTLGEARSYRRDLVRLSAPEGPIDEMRQFFALFLDERVVSTRQLKRASAEGVILNPNTLAQTVAEIRAGRNNPPAFLEYERKEREREAQGRFDCYLLVDCSDSMSGDRIRHARLAAIVFMEGLAAFELDIRERERQGGVSLDWDVRSAVYKFETDATILKPLSHSLTEAQRLDATTGLRAKGQTSDYLALEAVAESIRAEITKNPESISRRRIVTVVTDGDSSNRARLASAIAELTRLGVSVVAIGIQTTSVERTYPKGTSIDDVKDLTSTLTKLLEGEITK